MVMEDRFDVNHRLSDCYTEQMTKLNEEILLFRDSIRDIFIDLEPLKEKLISNILSVIKNCIPGGDLEVYGSYATKLCLPWSDIDLVVR